MGRSAHQSGDVELLDDPARVHHEHPLTQLRDDRDVVRDENRRCTGRGADVIQQLEDLLLDSHVEGRGGLVGNDQLRGAHQTHGDHDSLAHPS